MSQIFHIIVIAEGLDPGHLSLYLITLMMLLVMKVTARCYIASEGTKSGLYLSYVVKPEFLRGQVQFLAWWPE